MRVGIFFTFTSQKAIQKYYVAFSAICLGFPLPKKVLGFVRLPVSFFRHPHASNSLSVLYWVNRHLGPC